MKELPFHCVRSILCPLFLVVFFWAPPIHAQQTAVSFLPDRTALEDGWNTLRPGGETTCSATDEYRFFVRPGDSERLVLFFEGGGACWNADTCSPDDRTYDPGIDVKPSEENGIFDLDNPNNPVADYSMVVVPYCTGDVHLGNRTATYEVRTDDGNEKSVSVPHRGQVNAQVVLDWVYVNFEDPQQILVTGSSAGGVATPFYADQVARQYENARVIGLGDGAGGYRSSKMTGVKEEKWGVPDVLRQYPGWEDFGGPHFGIESLYLQAAEGTPNLELYQFDQAHDRSQRAYLERAGTPDADLPSLIRTNRSDIQRATDSFRSFTVGGFSHTVMSSHTFYFYRTGDHLFHEWVAAVVAGEDVASVDCRSCDRPEFQYSEVDLKLIERTRELLSSEEVWNSKQDNRKCPQEATTWSLWCAVVDATRRIGEESPGAYPAARDVVYEAASRLDADRSRRPLIRYNNHEATTFADVQGLLTAVQKRVEAGLANQTGDRRGR